MLNHASLFVQPVRVQCTGSIQSFLLQHYRFKHPARKQPSCKLTALLCAHRSLAKLWAQLQDDWERFGYYFQPADGVPAVQQAGVMRVNCIDCLDRTNVVQGLLGRKHLEATLARAGLLPPGAMLETAFPAVRCA